jgi:tRNA(adenine34) deaminase
MAIDHTRFMAMAIEEARAGRSQGEQPFGAVIALNGEVVCRSRSLKVSTSDTTAHAETLAVRYASTKLRQRNLPEETIFYATCEPCPMCLGAVLNAGIGTVVIGARHAQLPGISYGDYSAERFAELTGWKVNIISGVLGEECVALYHGFASDRRR